MGEAACGAAFSRMASRDLPKDEVEAEQGVSNPHGQDGLPQPAADVVDERSACRPRRLEADARSGRGDAAVRSAAQSEMAAGAGIAAARARLRRAPTRLLDAFHRALRRDGRATSTRVPRPASRTAPIPSCARMRRGRDRLIQGVIALLAQGRRLAAGLARSITLMRLARAITRAERLPFLLHHCTPDSEQQAIDLRKPKPRTLIVSDNSMTEWPILQNTVEARDRRGENSAPDGPRYCEMLQSANAFTHHSARLPVSRPLSAVSIVPPACNGDKTR